MRKLVRGSGASQFFIGDTMPQLMNRNFEARQPRVWQAFHRWFSNLPFLRHVTDLRPTVPKNAHWILIPYLSHARHYSRVDREAARWPYLPTQRIREGAGAICPGRERYEIRRRS